MLDGGLVARRPYLIVGPSGTGKTTLALQFLCAGVRNGENTLLVTLEEPPNEVRLNHRGLAPELGKVEVFDAIPDVMRYERAPFKDIAAVRSATPFERVSDAIRRTPELTSIEVTITALEQMLRTEVQRHAYSRIAIDSLTALQYFCMKGFDIVAGAQTFLRFLSDLRVTTILTVEAPLEDVETPERMLARGEIRLFRWELDDLTVRAIGVEKFRGSSHDLRLHPYRIGPTGLDINLGVTISRDTRQILDIPPLLTPGSVPYLPVGTVPSTLEVLTEELHDLELVGADTGPIRTELEAALASARQGDRAHATERLTRAVAIGATLPEHLLPATTPPEGEIAQALRRLVARAESSRAGQPPVRVPEPPILTARLAKILTELKPAVPLPAERPAVIPSPTAAGSAASPVAPPLVSPGAPAPAMVVAAPSAPGTVPSSVGAPGGAAATPHAPPTGHASPPPLPKAMQLPETAPVPRPTAVPPTHPSRRAPSATRSTVPGTVLPSTPPAASAHPPLASVASEGITAAATTGTSPSEAPPPKKRKRSSTGARRKTAAAPPLSPAPAPRETPPEPGALPSTPVTLETIAGPSAPAGSEPGTPASPGLGLTSTGVTAAVPSSTPEAAPSARPKRRVVRKKKAPSVVGATPGPPSEESPAEPSPAPAEPPPVEPRPEAP